MSDIFELRAAVAKALSHPTRLRILDMLVPGEAVCVCDLVARLEESQSSVSKHLAVLKEAGIVESRKEGLMVFYSLRTTCVRGFLTCLDQVLKADLEAKRIELEGESNK
ncbi:MAG: helix-turn-helix transcriptional regulator [Firmicutes bacterium]|nr:helix-turn-helix transcriptional regulator [Bacillota bacterium]